MVSTPKQARIVGSSALGPDVRVLDLQMLNGQRLEFSGGKYIIVHTTIKGSEGKIVKRPYSMISSDSETECFQLAVRRISDGVGSPWFQDIALGSVISFSGPWGRWFVEDKEVKDSTLVFATDTGITAAMGLTRSQGFRARLKRSPVLWCATSSDYFLPLKTIRAAIQGCAEWSFQVIPVSKHPDRMTAALAAVEQVLPRHPVKAAYLVGDGAVLLGVQSLLVERGVALENIRCEAFFNRPPKGED